MKRGILLFAHGARDPRWAQPFEAVATRIRSRDPSVVVGLAYLELMTPTLDAAADELAQAGCSAVDVVPMFLGSGGHVRNDLPRLLERVSAAHPRVQWRLARAIGEVPTVIDAMAEAALARPVDGAGQPDP